MEPLSLILKKRPLVIMAEEKSIAGILRQPLQEPPEMVQNGPVAVVGGLGMVRSGVFKEFIEELQDGDIVLAEAKFVPGDLDFGILKSRLSHLF
jgi:hypothetical protein